MAATAVFVVLQCQQALTTLPATSLPSRLFRRISIVTWFFVQQLIDAQSPATVELSFSAFFVDLVVRAFDQFQHVPRRKEEITDRTNGGEEHVQSEAHGPKKW